MDFNSLIFLGFFAGVAALTYCFPRQAKPYFLLLLRHAAATVQRTAEG